MAIHVGRNFCIAPFTQITLNPIGGYSPCPEIGGRPWAVTDFNFSNLWNDDNFAALRDSFSENEQNSVCNRCWDQEKVGKQSLRKRLFTTPYLKENIIEFLDRDYKKGPRQINLMVGNLCNLRCRICTAGVSVTYNKEGEFYEKKHNLINTRYTSEIKKPIEFSQEQIDQIVEFSSNLIRLEFYGGEPLLDTATFSLLEKLIANGRSKKITLFYNTNGVVKPSQQHYELWNQFKALEFNLSYDDIGERFNYARYPAKWENALANLDHLRNNNLDVPVQFTAICTVSILNVYYLREIIKELNHLSLPFFLNIVDDPDYYNISYLPSDVKKQILNHLGDDISEIKFVLNMLSLDTEKNHWEEFKFWTKEKDAYRDEDFAVIYPEFYSLLHRYDNTF
jgi:MoaA/NifB/PqqE/SkfB family radical SAM enzyme